MNRKEEFDAIFERNESNIEESIRFSKQLNRDINKKLYKKSIITIVFLIVIAIVGYFSTSLILNISHYNPIKNNMIEYADGSEESGYHKLMATFTNTFLPGTDYIKVGEDKTEGFSSYIMEGQFTNRFNQLIMGEDISKVKIQYSSVREIENRPIPLMNQFYDLEKKEDEVVPSMEKREMIEELEKMPISAQIDMTLSLKKRMKIDDFLEFKKNYKDTTFIYMASYIHDGAIYLGTTPYTAMWGEYSEEFNSKYPSLQEIKEETREGYEKHYIASLQFLIDNKNFIRTIFPTIFSHGEPLVILQEEVDKVKKEGLSFVGLRVYASRDDAINLIENENVMHPTILDAKFSKYENTFK